MGGGMRTFCIAVACLNVVTAAQAADLYVPPAPTPTGFNWTGFYVGAMAGYGWGTGHQAGFSGNGADLTGGFAGGTVGFNWQPVGSQLVVGGEADGAWSNIGAPRRSAGLG